MKEEMVEATGEDGITDRTRFLRRNRYRLANSFWKFHENRDCVYFVPKWYLANGKHSISNC